MQNKDWWFDGDYSECYYAWGHVDRHEFAVWIISQDDGIGVVPETDIEYLWVYPKDEETLSFAALPGVEPKPITRYDPLVWRPTPTVIKHEEGHEQT